MILPTLIPNSGYNEFPLKRNSAPINTKKTNNNNNNYNFIGYNETIPRAKNTEKFYLNSITDIKGKNGGGGGRERMGIRLKKSSSIRDSDSGDGGIDISQEKDEVNTKSILNSNSNLYQENDNNYTAKNNNNGNNNNYNNYYDNSGIRISQSASCGSYNNNNHSDNNNNNNNINNNTNVQYCTNTNNNDQTTHNLNNTHNTTNTNNTNNTHTTNDSLQYDEHNTPSSPTWGRSRSFSTGTGTTSHMNDSSISTASSGFFSRLLATPSKRLRKFHDSDSGGVRRRDKEREKDRSGFIGYNNNNGGNGNGNGGSGVVVGGGGNGSERDRERERGDEESVGSRGGMSIENHNAYDNYSYDDQTSEEMVFIKSKLCLRVSVKSSSRYRLCDSNPQEEGDATWACATGIFTQSFIIRGDDCDTDSRLVASDRLVSIIVDSKITNVNGEIRIEKHSFKDSNSNTDMCLTDDDHLLSHSEKSKKEPKVY